MSRKRYFALLSPSPMSNTFKKSERLKSRTLINRLFEREGCRQVNHLPFRFRWKMLEGHQPSRCQVLIVVSKRNVRLAVNRNRIKRQLRELYRLNKNPLLKTLEDKQARIALMVSVQSNESLIFQDIGPIFAEGVKKLCLDIQKNYPGSIPAADRTL